MNARAFLVATSLAFAAAAFACSGPDGSEKITVADAVVGAEFRPVAIALVERCGSIDCHGSKYRNFRLYGFGSARIDPSHFPDAPETTQEEADLDYEAVASLEPDLFRQVIAEGGARPERLTFYRKGALLEAHKGGQRLVPGDPADLCVRSWLASKVDAAACRAVVPRLDD